MEPNFHKGFDEGCREDAMCGRTSTQESDYSQPAPITWRMQGQSPYRLLIVSAQICVRPNLVRILPHDT